MDLYTRTSYALATSLTKRYSTSFSLSTNLIDTSIRHHIFAIYGLVRIGDEIVDTYQGDDRAKQLADLEAETYTAIKKGFSTNPIVHAFAQTAQQYDITKSLIHPFFKSMHMDLSPVTYTQHLYEEYIYGSAEVVGLMCLKVFCGSDTALYTALTPGAKALGAAYQKVNFLRDIASDYTERGRVYFPNTTYASFSENDKARIIADIRKDFIAAKPAVDQLPTTVRSAVALSYHYYETLLRRLEATPAADIKTTRIRVPTSKKITLLAKVRVGL